MDKLNKMTDLEQIQHYIACKQDEDFASKNIKYEWLVEHMEAKYKKSKWRCYILNYLLINFCCRNNDLDCLMLTKNDYVGCDAEKENFLVVMDDETIQWVRCDYKTNKTLDALTYVIRDEKFVRSVKELMNDSNFLFNNGTDERIDRRSIGRVIANATYNHLGQQSYFNIIRKHFKNDAEKLLELAKSRPVALRSVVY